MGKNEMVALDVKLNEVENNGIAYYRLDPHMWEFFQKCRDKHGIIGFAWDPDDPWNFGVILGKGRNIDGS